MVRPAGPHRNGNLPALVLAGLAGQPAIMPAIRQANGPSAPAPAFDALALAVATFAAELGRRELIAELGLAGRCLRKKAAAGDPSPASMPRFTPA